MFSRFKRNPFLYTIVLSVFVHVCIVVFIFENVKTVAQDFTEQYDIVPVSQLTAQEPFIKNNLKNNFKKKANSRIKSESAVVSESVSPQVEPSQHDKAKVSANENLNTKTVDESHRTSQDDSRIVQPRIMNRVVFNRTHEARVAHYEGDSKLKVKINKSGTVMSVELLNSLPYGLNERSLEIVNNLKMTPAYVAGVAIDYEFIFTIRYRNE